MRCRNIDNHVGADGEYETQLVAQSDLKKGELPDWSFSN